MGLCAYCRESFEGHDGAGRPSSYCSRACRRGAQSERQRIVRHLERLEAERMNRRHAARRGDRIRIALPSGLVTAAERLTEIDSDIAELRARLGVLLADAE
jgi:hypothetical protein